ncbi:MAG: F0F1 ATP synthase subunit alpha [Oscillospiraceae bacterium]|nr:F0F1 ATP synthase subunit alpha [Oscillospiraceae bacterium]
MGAFHYHIIYGLINFAILAAGLYFIGRKLIPKLFGGNRQKIQDSLDAADQAVVNARTIRERIEAANTRGTEECAEILRNAETTAGAEKQRAEEADRHTADSLKADTEKEIQYQTRTARRALTRTALMDITARAASLMGQPQYQKARENLTETLIQRAEKELVITRGELNAYRERKGDVPVELRSAEPLQPEQVSRIRNAVLRALRDAGETPKEEEISVTEITDESLIGGTYLRVGDTVYDRTLKSMLERASEEVSILEHDDEEMVQALKEELRKVSNGADIYQTGTVSSVSDGICRITGVSDAMAGELIEFNRDLRGMVMDLEKDNIGVVLLGDYTDLQEGDKVRRSGRIIEVPVGEDLIGRVVDSLGNPIDGAGEIHTTETRPIESPAPGVIARRPVSVPMQTGIKAIDALIPIGRGQRELIIGDRQTGKTAIALDAIINQKGKDMICIYVAIGQKESTVAGCVQKLREHDAMDYTIVVCASASESAPMLYIAPYAGAAMGEYFMHKGKDVLIVYDDLSKQAVAYREISLLLHRPPGREAYPGDVFYLHSRLLERAARLGEEYGGGSMTALPIIETQAGDISAYIPTNVISITDGQIFLETDLFNSGVRPAVNVGLSVSRVGGSAQLGAMKQVAGRLRMDLAQYRELAAFSQFGSDLDKATRATLHRGDRMTELLKQGQYAPMEAADQVISIYAVNEGFADGIELKQIPSYEKGLIPWVNGRWPELHARINSGKKLDDDELKKLKALIASYTENFQT